MNEFHYRTRRLRQVMNYVNVLHRWSNHKFKWPTARNLTRPEWAHSTSTLPSTTQFQALLNKFITSTCLMLTHFLTIEPSMLELSSSEAFKWHKINKFHHFAFDNVCLLVNTEKNKHGLLIILTRFCKWATAAASSNSHKAAVPTKDKNVFSRPPHTFTRHTEWGRCDIESRRKKQDGKCTNCWRLLYVFGRKSNVSRDLLPSV